MWCNSTRSKIGTIYMLDRSNTGNYLRQHVLKWQCDEDGGLTHWIRSTQMIRVASLSDHVIKLKGHAVYVT